MHKTMAGRNTAVEPNRRMHFRIGVNQGDVVYDDARIYGDRVNVAARLDSIAGPGSICISGKVHAEILGKIETTIRDLGLQHLKNIAAPVLVYRLEQPPASDARSFVAQALDRRPALHQHEVVEPGAVPLGGAPFILSQVMAALSRPSR
jgi:adenylate cyclase